MYLFFFFLPGVHTPHVYVRAWALGCFQSYQYPNLSEGADRIGGQLRGDKEYPFSGVPKSGRVWRKVPESDARNVIRTYPQNCPTHWQSPDQQGSSREQWRKGAWPQEERGACCERHVTKECGWRVRRRRGPESGQRTTWSAGCLTVDLRILSIAQVRKNWREKTFSLDLGTLT